MHLSAVNFQNRTITKSRLRLTT